VDDLDKVHSMMRRAVVSIFGCSLLLVVSLASCRPAQSDNSTLPPINESPTVTVRSEPTQTKQSPQEWSPTEQSVTDQVAPSLTLSPISSEERDSDSTPMPMPSPTPTPTATVQPLVFTKFIEADPDGYILGPPIAEDLIILINESITKANKAMELGDASEDGVSPNQVTRDLSEIVDFELSRNYPDGIPNPRRLLETFAWDELGPNYYLPLEFMSLLEDAVAQYIQEEEPTLSDGESITGPRFTAEIHLIEIDGDPDPEWLLKTHSPQFDSIFWVVLDQVGSSLRQIKSGLGTIVGLAPHFDLVLEGLGDFTGDGLTDVILYSSSYMMGRSSVQYSIYQGTKDGFVSLTDTFHDLRVQADEFLDVDVTMSANPYKPVLTLTKTDDMNWDCRFETTHSYSWPGGVERVTVTGEEPPDTPECLLAHFHMDPEKFSTSQQISMLERALHGFDPNDEHDWEKMQFIRYQLALIYSLSGQQSSAKLHLNQFVHGYTEADYGQKDLKAYVNEEIAPFLTASSINPIKLCEAGYNGAGVFTGWHPFINFTALSPGNTYRRDIWNEAICGTGYIISQYINYVKFNPLESPGAALEAAGIPVIAALPYQLNSQNTPAWFVMVDDETVLVFGYVPHDGQFTWERLGLLGSNSGEQTWLTEDHTGGQENLIAFSNLGTDSGYCPDDEESIQVFVVTNIGGGKSLSADRWECQALDISFDLEDYLIDQDGDGYIDWVMEEIRSYTDDLNKVYAKLDQTEFLSHSDLWELDIQDKQNWLDFQITTALLSRENISDVRRQLIERRDAISDEDPYSNHGIQHYSYLIALSYELEGDQDAALRIYHTTAWMYPRTPFGDLAAFRLISVGKLTR
jgi:hypothetical protein